MNVITFKWFPAVYSPVEAHGSFLHMNQDHERFFFLNLFVMIVLS